MSESVRAASYAIMNLASADSPGAVTSFMLRVTIDRRLSSSALLGGTGVTRLSASSFFQLIVVAYHKQLGLVQYPRQKLILVGPLLGEFCRCVDDRINLTSEQFPSVPQRQSKLCRGQCANHHQIDVAFGLFLATNDRAVNESGPNFREQWFDRIGQYVNEAGRLEHQAPKIGK